MSDTSMNVPANALNKISLLDRIGIASRAGGFSMADYWIWCPSVIQGEDGKYHMFASRWPKWLPFHPAWLTNSEVVRAISDTPEGPYTFQEVVLPARGAMYWDGRATHNPRITKWQDRYILFYTGITHPFEDVKPGENLTTSDYRTIAARSSKRIGIATSNSVFGPWKRMEAPILPTRPGTFYSFLTSNPAPCIHPDGSVLLMFKSRQYVGNTHSDMMIGVARADHVEGPYQVIGHEPIFSPDQFGVVEDPFIWSDREGYHLIAKDMSGQLCGELHGGVLGHSADGIHWRLADRPQAYSRTLRWDDGTTQTMGSLERTSLLLKDNQPTHFVAAVADGPGFFTNASRTWNIIVPLH